MQINILFFATLKDVTGEKRFSLDAIPQIQVHWRQFVII